jgi:D-glycero-D-manno-heptose 1,7-bisphosphate phosphatase
MEAELGRYGAYIDALYYCPHHPDKGFPGERPELKIDCDCRKPKPGLLLRAARDFNIDLSQSWMAGDDARDIGAGQAAGCKTALIGNAPLKGGLKPDAVFPSLTDFVLTDFARRFI